MPHFDINYIILNRERNLRISFPVFIIHHLNKSQFIDLRMIKKNLFIVSILGIGIIDSVALYSVRSFQILWKLLFMRNLLLDFRQSFPY